MKLKRFDRKLRNNIILQMGLANCFLFLIMCSFCYEVLAIDLISFIRPSSNEAYVQFTTDRMLTLSYDVNSILSKNLAGINESVSFEADMSTPGMSEIISIINQNILTQEQSPAQIESATIDYNVTMAGSQGQLNVSYFVKLESMMQDTVLPSQNTYLNIVDLDWRSIIVPQPLNLTVSGLGKINVNQPIGVFENKQPAIASELKNSELQSLLMKPLFDFQLMNQSLDTWDYLFNPNVTLTGNDDSGYGKDRSPKVESIFSLGEGSFNGSMSSLEQEATAIINDTDVNLHALSGRPDAQIHIIGFAQVRSTPSGEFVTVTQNAPQNKTFDSILVNLTSDEKFTIEKDANSVMDRCIDKMNTYDNEGLDKCDIYLKYLLEKCDQFADTLNYCINSKFSNYFLPRYGSFRP